MNDLGRGLVVLLGIAAFEGCLIWGGARMMAPRLDPRQERFRAYLPSFLHILAVWSLLALPLLFILIGPIGPKILREGGGAGFYELSARAMLVVILAFFVLLLGVVAIQVAKSPFAIGGDGESVRFYCLLGVRVYPISGARAGFAREEGAAAAEYFHLSNEKRREFIRLIDLDPSQREFFGALTQWAVQRGARGEDFVVPFSPRLLAGVGRIARGAGVFLLFWFAAFPISAAVSWVVQWFWHGGQSIFLDIIYGVPIAILGGVALGLSPVAAGFRKLLVADWPASGEPGAIPVSAEPLLDLEGYWSRGKGELREIEGDLRLVIGPSVWRIARGDIIEIRPCGGREGWWHDYATGRLIGYPVELAWKDEAGTIHRLALAARGGRSFGEDRRNDRPLGAALLDWRAGKTGALAAIRVRPPIFWCSAAAATLAFAVAAPLFLLTVALPKVESGAWLPPARIQPKAPPAPIFSVQALADGPSFAEDMRTEIRLTEVFHAWRGESPLGPWRAIMTGFMPTIYSSPGSPSHALVLPEIAALRLPMRRLAGRSMAHVRSAADLSARAVRSLPNPAERHFDTALWGGERIFAAIRGDWRAGEDWQAMRCVWVEVRSDALTEVGLVRPEEFWGNPVFFPAGNHVLFAGFVIGLDDCSIRPLEFAPGNAPPQTAAFRGFLFAGGTSLRILDAPRHDDPAARRAVWQIDPASARAEVIETLDRWQSILSADGERWLLQEPTEKRNRDAGELPSPRQLYLFDRAANERRPLFAIDSETRAMLIEGKDEVLLYSETHGYERRSIAPADLSDPAGPGPGGRL